MRLLALSLACISFACLPAGNQPVGQHLLVDRSLSGVFLTASETAGAPAHLLVAGPPRPDPGLSPVLAIADLYSIPYAAGLPANQDLASLTPVVRDVVLVTANRSSSPPSTDSDGRLVYFRAPATPGSSDDVVERFDFQTGLATALADFKPANRGFGLELSPGRTRLYVDGPPVGRLFDRGGAVDLRLGLPYEVVVTSGPLFLGEDFYYQTCTRDPSRVGQPPQAGDCHVARSRPGFPPEDLYSLPPQVFLAAAIATDQGAQLLLANRTPERTLFWTLLDTQSLTVREIPIENDKAWFKSASGNGHWLLFIERLSEPGPNAPGACRLSLVDWTTGRRASIDSAAIGQSILCSSEWRPGREELWIDLDQGASAVPARRTLVWKPGLLLDASDSTFLPQRTARPHKLPEVNPWLFDRGNSLFSRDGRYWFSQSDPFVSSKSLWSTSLGVADAPSAPTVPVAPNGEALIDLWEMQDGRLLVGASITLDDRQNIYVVDPTAGTGRVLALGKTRALALLNWSMSRTCGDLTLIDLATGAQTLLAEDVYALAVDPGVTAKAADDVDRLPPGVRIAFLTRYRLESPDDGLWVANLP